MNITAERFNRMSLTVETRADRPQPGIAQRRVWLTQTNAGAANDLRLLQFIPEPGKAIPIVACFLAKSKKGNPSAFVLWEICTSDAISAPVSFTRFGRSVSRPGSMRLLPYTQNSHVRACPKPPIAVKPSKERHCCALESMPRGPECCHQSGA